MRSRRMKVTLVCGLVIACGSQSRVDHISRQSGGDTGGSCDPICDGGGAAGTLTAGRAGAATAGANAGEANVGGANAGTAGSGGAGGIRGLSPTPPSCVTSDGTPGIVVDVFPLPAGTRTECEALNQPGDLDLDCPSDVLLECSIEDCYEARTLPGCCRPDGFCGLLESGYWGRDIALGCISRAPWIEHGEEVLRRPVVPVRCD